MFDLFDLMYLRPTGMRVYVHIIMCVCPAHMHTHACKCMCVCYLVPGMLCTKDGIFFLPVTVSPSLTQPEYQSPREPHTVV